jgi:hypothetical protein
MAGKKPKTKPNAVTIQLTFLEAEIANDRLGVVQDGYGDGDWLRDNDVDPATVPPVPDVLGPDGKAWDEKGRTGGTLTLTRSPVCTYDLPEKLAYEIDFNFLDCPVTAVEEAWGVPLYVEAVLGAEFAGRDLWDPRALSDREIDKLRDKVVRGVQAAARSLLKKINAAIRKLPPEAGDDDEGEES